MEPRLSCILSLHIFHSWSPITSPKHPRLHLNILPSRENTIRSHPFHPTTTHTFAIPAPSRTSFFMPEYHSDEPQRERSRSRRRSRSPRRSTRRSYSPRSRSPSRDGYRRNDRRSRSPLNSTAPADSHGSSRAPAPRTGEDRTVAKEHMMQHVRDSSQQDRRVYVGNLSYDVKWHHLKDFMRQGI